MFIMTYHPKFYPR